MQLSTFDKANCSRQNLPQGKQTLSGLVNNTRDLKPDKFLTDILASEASHCSLIDFIMHWRDGSKNEATSELRNYVVQPGRDYWRHTQEVSTGQCGFSAWDHYHECCQTWYREAHLHSWTRAWQSCRKVLLCGVYPPRNGFLSRSCNHE